jgi:hypothetical protein
MMKTVSLSSLLLVADAKRADWMKIGPSPPETVRDLYRFRLKQGFFFYAICFSLARLLSLPLH